jgi:modulator of FtsH protease
MAETQFVTDGQTAVVSTNKVLRNTYMLLSMTLVFSAVTAWLAMAIKAPPLGFIPLLVGFFGLYYAVNKTQNSVWGIFWTFALTGFFGFVLGPVISHYMALANGPAIVMQALGMTGFIFFSLSGYALVTRKDFTFLGGFLFTGFMVVVGAMLLLWVGGMFGLQISGLSLAISGAIVLLMSGYILFTTSNILNGGETNYIMATVTLYLSIYNIFTSLLHIFGATSD